MSLSREKQRTAKIRQQLQRLKAEMARQDEELEAELADIDFDPDAMAEAERLVNGEPNKPVAQPATHFAAIRV